MATAGDARGTGAERAWAPCLPAHGEIELDAEESAHLVRSRRVREGQLVVLFDGRGAARQGRLVKADPRAARVRVEGEAPAREPKRRLRMAVSLPEMGRADRLVLTLAELGVTELAPLACARTPAGRDRQAARRGPRWAKLAREACKVNGASRALVVGPTLPFAQALQQGAVLLDPDPRAPALLALREATPEDAWLLVGPEGGFTSAEVAGAREQGLPVARVGELALRVETAAAAAAALWLASEAP